MKLIRRYRERCCYDVSRGRKEFFKEYLDYHSHAFSRWKGPNGVRYYMNIDLMTNRIDYDDYFSVGIFEKLVDHDSSRRVCITYWKYRPTKRELWRYAKEKTIEKSRPVFNPGTIWI